MPQIGFAGDISPNPGDEDMWVFLQKCLDECTKGHEICKAAQDTTWRPQRLLHLAQDKPGKDSLKLVLTQDHPPTSPYIALSHCWGSTPPFCTTTQNITRLMEYIPLSELPRTFQDCVVAARKVGVQYIWIDSLCIVQDDREDWARHARCMDKVYETALFTVAAVASPDGSVPFLGPEAHSDRDQWQAIIIDTDTDSINSESVEQGSQRARLKVRRTCAVLLPSFIRGPLEHRGWTWQERYLSVRTMNFTQQEARWTCKTSEACECRGIIKKRVPGLPQLPPPSEDEGKKPTYIRDWRYIVTEYSSRHLTYSTDRLPALSGAASRFHTSVKSEYLAGIWVAHLPHSLAWYRREPSDEASHKSKIWRSLDNGVPSWSWASIAGEANWIWGASIRDHSEEDMLIESRVELLSISCKPISDNIFGEVEIGSYIELRGMVVEAEMESDIYGCGCVRRRGFGPQHVVPDCHIIPTTNSSFPLFNSNTATALRRAVPTDRFNWSLRKGRRSKGHVYCLLLFTTTQDGTSHACVLILSKQEGSGETYQRLGIGNDDAGFTGPLYNGRKNWKVWEGWDDLEQWREWEKWFSDGVVRTLKIV